MIAIIGTLVGLLLPAVQSARESARRDGTERRRAPAISRRLDGKTVDSRTRR